MSDSSLEKVNAVVLWQSLIGRILDFGDVKILTASKIGVNNFETMKSPVRFKTAMLNQKEALGADEPPRGTERTEGTEGTEKPPEESKGRISDLISGLEKLRLEGAVTDKEFADNKNAASCSDVDELPVMCRPTRCPANRNSRHAGN
jgi:hypothetical protein